MNVTDVIFLIHRHTVAFRQQVRAMPVNTQAGVYVLLGIHATLFFIRQAASGNWKAGFHSPYRYCLIHETTRYYVCVIQSRDAKSCVSQAMMRINRGEDMPVVALLIARETQDFVSFHGWCHHCFNVKQARLAIIMFSCHFEDYTPACLLHLCLKVCLCLEPKASRAVPVRRVRHHSGINPFANMTVRV